jgi:hypothetical protein
MQCDTSLDKTPSEPIKTLFVSSVEHTISNKNSSECMEEIIPQNFSKSDLDELYASLDVDKYFEIFACECGVCNVCHEISVTTCAEIQANSTTLEFDTKNVDFTHKQPLPIAEKLLVETPIKQQHAVFFHNLCIAATYFI